MQRKYIFKEVSIHKKRRNSEMPETTLLASGVFLVTCQSVLFFQKKWLEI